MSRFDPHLSDCDREPDAAAYVLDALSADEASDFEAHVSGCRSCSREVAELRAVVDSPPMAAIQYAPAPALKDRIMRVVTAEAELLAAAGPEADRPPRRTEATARSRWGWLTARPAFAALGAAMLVALGVVGGVLASGTGTPATRTVAASVASQAAGRADVALTGDKASLRLASFSAPPSGYVYQVWLMRKGGKPVPTHTLFNVRQDGRATVEVEEPVKGYDQMLVTAEPSGGSQQPTGAPVITANI